MKYESFKYVLSLIIFVLCVGSYAQGNSANPFGGDPFGGLSDSSLSIPALDTEATSKTTQSNTQGSTEVNPFTQNNTDTDNSKSTANTDNKVLPEQNATNPQQKIVPESNTIESSDLQSPVQDAVIEGVQITSDQGKAPDEKVISGYFIFRDKPSSYFYEVKLRDKKLVFEFNDTKVGSAPVPSVAEAPIKGFTITSDKVDINKDVKGLKPEYHDMIRVVFDLEAVPEIHVNDEYSIITFSFKWTTNPQLLPKYVVKDNTPKIVLWSSVGVGAVGLGTLVYFLAKGNGSTGGEPIIPTDDLPKHPTPNGN